MHDPSLQKNEKRVNSLFSAVVVNWGIVAAAITGIIAYTTLTLKTSANSRDISSLIDRTTKDEQLTQASNVATAAQYSQIETDLQWIKAKLK